jgi:hypothetical protein
MSNGITKKSPYLNGDTDSGSEYTIHISIKPANIQDCFNSRKNPTITAKKNTKEIAPKYDSIVR